MHAHRPPVTDRKVRFAVLGCGRIDRDADEDRVVAALVHTFLPSA